MKKIKFYLSICAAVGAITLLPGCASMDTQRTSMPEPKERLNEMLRQDQQAMIDNSHCRDTKPSSGPVVDCSGIRREVDRLYTEFPEQKRVLMANAVLQFESGNMPNAQFMLDQLLGKSGSHPEAAILRSRIALSEGNTSAAREVLKRQILLAPDYPDLREALAAVYYVEGRYEEARNQLQLAGRLGAPAWRIMYHRGVLNEGQQRSALACKDYQKAVTLNPRFRPAMARLIGLSNEPGCEGIPTALQSYRLSPGISPSTSPSTSPE